MIFDFIRMRRGLAPLRLIAGLMAVPACGGFVRAADAIAPSNSDPAPQLFSVPAGEADRTLGIFSRQSLQAAIFPTDLLEGVRTHAVRGEFTPLKALSLMLAGTTLQPSYDATTGALVVRSVAGAGPVVELPPYVVETNLDVMPWTYMRAPGVEVISRCSEVTTELLLSHHFRLHEMLAIMLPEELRVKLDVPTAYVLFNEATQPGMAREVLEEVRKRQGRAAVNIGGLANYRFHDRDAVTIFFIINEHEFSQGRLSLTADYVRYMLESRTPSLPLWFIDGMMEVYRSTLLESAAPLFATSATIMDRVPEGSFTIRPLQWVSETETHAVKRNVRQKREFLPLGELFTASPAAREPARAALGRSESALFIRWALHESGPDSRRAALWTFVSRASRQPVTEAMFRECFGLDYATAENQLLDYLPVAVKSTIYLKTGKLFELPGIETREATDGEVSRIKGGLDRLEVTYVKGVYPELTGRYLQQARRTLRKAYDKGDRDPRLLAELGLCECDAGDDVAARPFLDAATRRKVVRPRAYYELARIDYEELLTRVPGGKFTIDEAGIVLRPLNTALQQSPQLPEIYELLSDVWLRTAARLSAAQLQVLDEGVRNFQWRTRLIYSTALLNSLNGRPTEARAYIDQGLAIATPPKERELFLKLQAVIAAEKPVPAP